MTNSGVDKTAEYWQSIQLQASKSGLTEVVMLTVLTTRSVHAELTYIYEPFLN